MNELLNAQLARQSRAHALLAQANRESEAQERESRNVTLALADIGQPYAAQRDKAEGHRAAALRHAREAHRLQNAAIATMLGKSVVEKLDADLEKAAELRREWGARS